MRYQVFEKEVAIIGSEELVNALRLLGIKTYYTIKTMRVKDDIKNIRDKLKEFIERQDIAVIIIEDSITDYVKDIIEEHKYDIRSVVIEVPSQINIKIHDPREYYKSRAKRVLGVSVEI